MKTHKHYSLALVSLALASLALLCFAHAEADIADTKVVSVPETCIDGKWNNHETDVDCGGVGNGCGKCEKEKDCARDRDCVTAYCNDNLVCAMRPSQSDGGIDDGGTTTVDLKIQPPTPDMTTVPDLMPAPDLTPLKMVFKAEGEACANSDECNSAAPCIGGKCTTLVPPAKPALGLLKHWDKCEKLDGSECESKRCEKINNEPGVKRCRVLAPWEPSIDPGGYLVLKDGDVGEPPPTGHPRCREGFGVQVSDANTHWVLRDAKGRKTNKEMSPGNAQHNQDDILTPQRCSGLAPNDGLPPLCNKSARTIDGYWTGGCILREHFFIPPPPPPPTCTDKLANQDETDVDCGGDVKVTNCGRCQEMDRCKQNSDCDMRYICNEGQCRLPWEYCDKKYVGGPAHLLSSDPECDACAHKVVEPPLWKNHPECVPPKPVVNIYFGPYSGFHIRHYLVPEWSAIGGVSLKLKFGEHVYVSGTGLVGGFRPYHLTVVAELKFGVEFLRGYLSLGINGNYSVQMNLKASVAEKMVGRTVGGGGHACIRPFNWSDAFRPLLFCGSVAAVDYSFPVIGGRRAVLALDALLTAGWEFNLTARRDR